MGTRFLIAVAALLAGCAGTGPTSASAPDLAGPDLTGTRPNIVFVFSDDHACHAIGAYARDAAMPFGSWLAGVDTTPNIDALAARGMRFRRSYCTNAICGPSRAVILTGKHSHVNGFMDNGDRFDGAQWTFPKALQDAGYATAMIGKWHLGSDPQGFDHWEVLPGQGDYYNPVLKSAAGERRIEGHCTDIVTDLALEWLDGAKEADEPFLLMCQHKAPHRTWMPALRHLELYDGDALVGDTLPEPPTLFDDYASRAPGARHQEMTIAEHMYPLYDLFVTPLEGVEAKGGNALDASGHRNLDRMSVEQRAAWDAYWGPRNAAFHDANLEGDALLRAKFQRYLANYLRCVRGVDESVGRITAWLEEHDLAENTIVVYASDQGFYLGDHGWYDKRWMYEESFAMPLIVQWPGRTEPGSVSDPLVQNLDYAATFLEMAGVDVPPDVQGRSLVPLLDGDAPDDWRDAIYYHYYAYPSVHMVPRHVGVRTERFKLVHYYPFGEWELFDLAEDPDELVNRFDDPALVAVRDGLIARLEELRREYGDETVTGVNPDWVERYR